MHMAEGPPKPHVDWTGLQFEWLVGMSRDLRRLGSLGRLPLHERLYHHSQGKHPYVQQGMEGRRR